MTMSTIYRLEVSAELQDALALLTRLHDAAMLREAVLLQMAAGRTRTADGRESPAGSAATGPANFDPQDELKALARLDPEAITRIHDRYFTEVYRFARYRLSDDALAEDVAAETFTRLLEHAYRGRGPTSNARGWLMRTAANLVNDYFRAMYSRPTAELSEEMPSTGPGPVGLFEDREEKQRLQEALRHLTEEQANVLALRFGSGLSVAETAKALGKNDNAVKALQFRAIGALRRELVQA
jgi:RNA polymerase sigma-70 factor (ECF subfamily)